MAMRILKIAAGLLAALLLIVYLLLPVPGADPEPVQSGVDAASLDLSYFKKDYDESRAHFREITARLTEQYPGTRSGVLNVPSAVDDDLTIDWLYVPARSAQKRLLILTSGLHGAEGPAGAAVQRAFLDRRMQDVDLNSTGVLAIHAINAYGFKYFRRVTENNVDLNRNFDEDDALFASKNEGYHTIYDLLNPQGPAAAAYIGERLFFLEAVGNILYYGMPALRQAALQGQYEFPEGIYFGGQAFEPQKELLTPLLVETARAYDAVVLVDFHTGYGSRGVLHLFPSEAEDERMRTATTNLYEGYTIDWAEEGGEFYSVTGEFTMYVDALLREDQLYIPMVFEYGTLNSDTTTGAIESIHRTIIENQGIQHGYASAEDEAEIKRRYREMFYPTSEAWRAKIFSDTDAMWDDVLPRLNEL